MKIILRKNVPNVGQVYELKEVTAGFANNKLLPQGLAWLATPANLKRLETLKKKRAEEHQVRQALLAQSLVQLPDLKITITAKANELGHLFASIHQNEIAAAVQAQAHLDLEPDWLILDRPIKQVGEFQIAVRAGDSTGRFTLVVVPLVDG